MATAKKNWSFALFFIMVLIWATILYTQEFMQLPVEKVEAVPYIEIPVITLD